MEANETSKAAETQTSTGEGKWGMTIWLPCELSLDLPVPKFTVQDLLCLRPQSVVETKWSQSRDIPLRANGKLLAWTELEVVGDHLAVRLTELT